MATELSSEQCQDIYTDSYLGRHQTCIIKAVDTLVQTVNDLHVGLCVSLYVYDYTDISISGHTVLPKHFFRYEN